jgi:hypothetical protein
MRIIALPVIAVCLLATGCGRVWDAANSKTLDSDVRSLLSASGIPGDFLACHMIETTREAECSFRAGVPAISALSRSLSLSPLQDGPSRGLLAFVKGKTPPDVPPDWHGVLVLAVTGRPPALRLKSGSAFEYLFLFHDATRNVAWLRVAYSSG